jgi:hypothetical protein
MNSDRRSARGGGDGADPWRRLAAAILYQSCRDAHDWNGWKAAAEAGLPKGVSLADDAQRFLISPAARALALELGLDPEVYRCFLADLPPPAQMALPGIE